MTLRAWWTTGLLISLAVAVAGCPDDGAPPPVSDATADGQDGTSDTGPDAQPGDTGPDAQPDTDGGAVHVDTVQPDELAVELFAATASGPRGVGSDLIELDVLDEPGAYAATPHYQMDFGARTSNVPKDTEVVLTIDGLVAGTSTVAITAGNDGSASFPEIELMHGSHTIEVAVTVGTRVAVDTNTVTLDVGKCDALIQPLNDSCLMVDADPAAPGFQASFTVTNQSGFCTHAQLEVNGPAGLTKTPPQALDLDGTAVITTTLTPSTGAIDSLSVYVTGVVLYSGASSLTGKTEALEYTVDTAAPALTITKPASDTLTMADDEGPGGGEGITTTVRGDVTGLLPDETDSIELLLDGESVGFTKPSASKKYQFAGVVLPAPGKYTLTVIGTDSCGQTGEVVKDVTLEGKVTPPAPGIDLVAATAGGDKGAGVATLELGATDEPAAYATQPGFQMDWKALTTNAPNGTTVTLVVDQQTVQGQVVSTDEGATGTATFPGITLTKGQHTLEATLTVPEAGTAAASKSVTVDLPACAVALSPATPGCLTEDASTDAGFQASFVVTNADKLCNTASLEITGPGGTVSSPSVPLDASGSAVIQVTLVSSTPADAVPVTVRAKVESTVDPALAAQSDPTTFTVDDTPPEVTIETPLDSVLTTADADGDPSNGVQLAITGTASSVGPVDTDALELRVDDILVASVTPGAGGSFDFGAVTFQGVGTYAIEVHALDACGHEGTANLLLTISEPPVGVTVLAPTEGATLLAKDDGDPLTTHVYETTFTVFASPAAEGATLTIECRTNEAGSVFAPMGSHVLTAGEIAASPDGEFDVDAQVDTQLVTTSVLCRATYASATSATNSDPVALTVALPAPTLVIVEPKSGDVVSATSVTVVLSADELDGMTPETTLLDSTGGEVGAAITASPISGGASTYDVDLLDGTGAALPDGQYTLSVDAEDAFGNLASDSGESETSVTFTLDRTAPGVAITAPAELLQPLLDPTAADQDLVMPGYQTTVTVSITGETDPSSVDVCLSLQPGSEKCASPAAGQSTVSFTGVTLSAGANTLSVTATDAAGNSADTTQPVTLELDAPVVTLLSPATDMVVLEGAIDVAVGVADTSGMPVSGAAVDLLSNGVSTGLFPTEGPAGTYTFTAVPLSPGANELQATATAAGKDGASSSVVVTYKDTAPSLTLTFPQDGAVFNTFSAECQAGINDCIVTATAVIENVADDVPVTLTVACGAATTPYAAVVAAGAATWTDVSLTDQTTCTVTANLTDLAGQDAQDGPFTVRVDRVAPILNSFAKPADSVIQPQSDEDEVTAGIQKTVSVSASGLEKDQTIAVKLVPDGTDPDTVSPVLFGTVPSNIPDAQKVTVTAGVMTVTVSGYYQLIASVLDAAGNPSPLLKKSIFVNVSDPLVSIVSPPYVEYKDCTTNATCGASGICYQGKCVTPWSATSVRQILAQTFAVPFGTNNIRVCSDNPLVTGPACATAGYAQAAIANVSTKAVTINLASVVDGVHTFIVEAETFPGSGSWISSLASGDIDLRDRHVLIDKVAPKVTSITSPSDTLPPLGALNQAEQTAPSTFDFTVVADKDGAPFDGTVTVFSNGQTKTTFPISAGSGTGPVVFQTDGSKKIQAVVKDAVGNSSTAIANPAAYSASYTVKVAPLTLAFTAPTKSPLLQNDNLDVSVTSNQTAGTVALSDAGSEVASKAVGANGAATFDHATYGVLSDGTHTLVATLTDTAGNVITATTAPPTVLVDTQPPTVAITSPTAGTLTDADDAAPFLGGFQVAVGFSTTGATSWKILLASNCAADFTGCGAAIERTSGPVTNPGGEEPPVLISVPVTAPETYHQILVRGVDENGNATTASVNIGVVLTECLITFTNLPADDIFNSADCAQPGCSSVMTDVTVQYVGPCGSIDTITLLRDGLPVGQSSDLGTQEATFSLTLNDGDAFTLWAEATFGGALVTQTTEHSILADFTPPTVELVPGTVLGFLTPATGADVTYGMADDQQPETQTTLEIHLTVGVTDNGATGGRIASLSATSGGNTIGLGGAEIPFNIDALPFSHDFKFVSLPDQGDYVVTVTAEDAAGNSAEASFGALVDVSPPEEVVLDPIDSATDVDPRLPAVTLRWQPPASNTGVAGGAAVAYEVRYSTTPITDAASFEEACASSALTNSPALPTPGDPAGATKDEYTVQGPDPRSVNTEPCKFATQADGAGYYFAVRAQDTAGNWSEVTGAGTAFTDAASLQYMQITHSLTAPNGDEARLEDRVYGIGDINGDGFDDIALGGQAMSGFCIVYGRDGVASPLADLDLSASDGDGYQCIFDGPLNGAGSPIINAGDINGDGQSDLAVGVGNKISAPVIPESVRVYLGVTGGGKIVPTPVLTVTGTSNNNLYGYRTLGAANFNGDTNPANGSPISDLVIPSGIQSVDRIKAFVVPGSTAFAPSTSTTIDLTNAAHRIANDVVTISMFGAAGNAYFGWAVAGAGDILPDDAGSFDEVAIAMAKDPAQVVVVRGRPVSGDTEIQLSNVSDGSRPGDATAVRLMPELGVGTNSFGSDLGTVFDFDGAGTPDILINHQYASATVGRFYLFYGEDMVGKEGTQVFVQPSGAATPDGAQKGVNGVMYTKQQNFVLPLGDFDGAAQGETGTIDVAYTVYSFTTYGTVIVRLNHATGGAGFFEGLLPTEDIVIRDPYNQPPSEKFGASWAPLGDFNGDGRPDLVVGTNGGGYSVLVY